MLTEPGPRPRVAPFHYRNDRRLGLLIIGGSFVASLLFSLWAREHAQPEESQPPGPPTTEGVVGWQKHVDPVATLAKARALTQRNLLRGMVADGVSSAGTIDFSAGSPDVRYAFQSPPGHGPQPARDHGTLPRHTYCGRQRVHIQKLGIVAEPDNSQASCSVDHSDGLPEPRCTLSQIWAFGKQKGAPTDRPARIEYYRSKAGPAWRFIIPNSPYRFAIAGDCQRELSEVEAFGFVP